MFAPCVFPVVRPYFVPVVDTFLFMLKNIIIVGLIVIIFDLTVIRPNGVQPSRVRYARAIARARHRSTTVHLFVYIPVGCTKSGRAPNELMVGSFSFVEDHTVCVAYKYLHRYAHS